MSLGACTKVEGAAGVGPVFVDRVTIVGDGAYGAGGSTGFLAKFRTAVGDQGRDIMAVIPQSAPSTVSELTYDHTNEKLFARVRTTGVESAVADQSAVTYQLCVISA